MVEMTVQMVALDQLTMAPVVILTDPAKERFLPIAIGPSEANAINLALEEVAVPRPLTHDLLQIMIKSLGGVVREVRITKLVEDTFFAEIDVELGAETKTIDARPSDSIALALRAQAPIRVAEAIYERTMALVEEEDPEMEDFKRFLEDLTPDDFRGEI